MKTLTTTSLIAALSLSGSAFAADNYFADNYKQLLRNSNPNDDGIVTTINTRVGSQPGVGSESRIHSFTKHRDFWSDNHKLLLRNSNPNDDGYVGVSQSRIGAQPGVGSASITHSVANHGTFWADNYQLLVRNSNPNDD